MAQIESVADLLKKHAETRGHRIAFSTAAGEAVTYNDLEVRTRQIARNLLNAGISRGCRVAIVLSSSIEAIESNFAITRAAAVGVPLDARSSQAELTRAFESSHAQVIITDHKRMSRVYAAISEIENIEQKVIILVVNKEGITIESSTEVEGIIVEQYEDWSRQDLTTSNLNLNHHHQLPLDNLGLNEPAWLFHTIGTTGHAKGVFISQYAFMWTAVNSLQAATSLNLTAADKIFWPLPLFHAFGHSLCVIGALSVGASAHLVGDQPLLDSLLQSKESTIIGGAPAIFQEITKSLARQALAEIQPRICISAGAAAPTRLSAEVESFSGAPGGVYPEVSCGSVPKGVDVQIRTLGPGGQILAEAADGDEGEICVQSPSFMLGYNDGSLSSSTVEDEQRILTVTGRIKELIIRGGENIHPLEVEDALRGSPGVADVVVTGVPHEMLGEEPVAFIEAEPNTILDTTKLLKQCRSVLPDYKVPVKFYNIDAIPRTASGKPKRLAAKRLPFDFKGPSLAIDSACSSSITAIHMATASLLTRESDLASAGGVAIMSTPRTFISFSRQKALSKDGYCRPYSADATGTSFSEGVGLVLLERLSDARRNGHNILSVIRGSAINSDGASFGLTAPSGKAQKDVISQTLRRAALSPVDVDVLDGHGTATVLGDPIELGAVLEVYGDRPLSN
ncbi:polyketide synthase type 1 [Penicillium malachiteum]|nr:polyketide synthase type 1 [Penicillium malachiteum]